jgi:membrane protease YdiL (CAAX protease family)
VKPRAVVFTDDGALRAPWRVVVFVVALVACAVVSLGMVGPPLVLLYSAIGLEVTRVDPLVYAVAILAAHWLTLRVIEKRPWSDVGLDAGAARPAKLVHGFVIGLVAISVPVAALVAIGWLAKVPGSGVSVSGSLARITVVLLPAALSEELLMRGYLFAVLRKAWGATWAVGVTSVLFAVIHLQNSGATFGSLIFVCLAGVFLACVLLATNSLYAAWMAHFAWNWAMAALFHTAVSGLPLETPGYRYVDAGPDWATGGEWGPEGGIPAGIGMLAALGYLHMSARRKRRQER